MASLRSMILDGRKAPGNRQLNEKKYAEYFEIARDALHSRDTILVDVNSVVRDIEDLRKEQHGTFPSLTLIPCPKPPYQTMWLEHREQSDLTGSLRFGHLVRRTDFADMDAFEMHLRRSPIRHTGKTWDAGHALGRLSLIEVFSWSAYSGYVEPQGDLVYWLNDAGEYQTSQYGTLDPLGPFESVEQVNRPENERLRLAFRMIYIFEFQLLHTFARMNCHNVKLVPSTASAPMPVKNGHERPAMSVWHEIVVDSLPKLRAEETGTAADGEKREVRFHKVRGHYADYTKGKGLFGRLKVRLWIEEHEAGNPELGEVVGRYKVN